MRVTLPKGNYYVGDPFLVLDQIDWPDFSDLPKGDIVQFKGSDVLWVETSRDHGEYIDSLTGDLIDISSGYIAVIPLTILEDSDTSAGAVIESSAALTVTVKVDEEYFKFGSMKLVHYSELDHEDDEESDSDDWGDWN